MPTPESRSNTPTAAPPDAGLGQGMETALTLALFLGIGWLVDRLAGTTPIFMIVLTVLAAVGVFAKLWYGYNASMAHLEAERAEQASAAGRLGRAAQAGRVAPRSEP